LKKPRFKIKNGKKYLFDFLSMFFAVISAFALNSWSENRNDKISEEKILKEIKNGIELDLNDFNSNIKGNKLSLRANDYFKDLVSGKMVKQDSAKIFYITLFRDYVPIINRSGYESLKASGMKTVTNDSLRLQIISLYDYYYSIIDLLEFHSDEMKSYPNYFKPINSLLNPYMNFDKDNNFLNFNTPIKISEIQKKEILSYLWKIDYNREYKLKRYQLIIDAMEKVKTNIQKELSD